MVKHELLSSLPALEFLSKASKMQLQPTQMMPGDAIEVELTDDLKRFIITPIQIYKGVRTTSYPSTNCRKTWFKRIPEAKPIKTSLDGCYRCGATDLTALVMAHQWDTSKMLFKSVATEQYWKFLIMRFFSQTKNALITAEFKLNKKVPDLPQDYIHHLDKTRQLSDYQKVALCMSLGQEIFALFMEQGTGKTPICIQRICMEAVRMMKEKKRMFLSLVVCPQQVRTNWSEEIERFATCPGQVSVLRGGLFDRNQALIDVIRKDSEALFGAAICSYQSVENTWQQIGTIPWDLVIFDESHRMKNPQSLQSKSCRKLRDGTAKRMILTGSPIANSIMDLWAQFEALGDGVSGFIDNKEFKKFFGKWEPLDKSGASTGSPEGEHSETSHGIQKLVALQNVPLIQERLARISFAITKKEAGLNLPDKVYDVYEVTMTPDMRDMYTNLKSELAIEIEDALNDDEQKVTADHVLTMLLRLAQITSGHIKYDPIMDSSGTIKSYGRVVQISPDNPKVEATLELINEQTESYEKVIIWCIFREDIRILQENLKKQNIKFVSYFGDTSEKDREEAINSYNNDPTVKVFIGNPKSASEGLNLLGYNHKDPEEKHLDTYTGLMIFFSQSFSMIERSQCEDRAHRRKMKGNLRITDLTVVGTIDQEIRQVVHHKRAMAAIIGDIRGFLGRVLGKNLDVD